MGSTPSPEAVLIVKDETKRYLPFLGTFRYVQNSFWTAGQDSYTEPPAQNPNMFELLTNVQPIMRGGIERRWGYSDFIASPYLSLNAATRLYSYQRDSDGERAIVATYPASGVIESFSAFSETGTTLSGQTTFITFSPGVPARAILSRGSLYFTNGNKWTGDTYAIAPVVSNLGAGSISHSNIYAVSYVDGSGRIYPEGGAVSLTSSGNSVLIPSPVAQQNMTGYVVDVNGWVQNPTNPTLIGTSTVISSLTSTYATSILTSSVPMGTSPCPNAATFVIGNPTSFTITVNTGTYFADAVSGGPFTQAMVGDQFSIGSNMLGTIGSYVSASSLILYVSFSGTVNTSGTAVTWVSGQTFCNSDGATVINSLGSPAWNGFTAMIDGAQYTISNVPNVTSMTLAQSAGVLTGVPYSVSYTLSGVPVGSQSNVSLVITNPDVSLSVGRIYFGVFTSTATGDISDLSPASATTGPMSNNVVQVSFAFTTMAYPNEFDKMALLATVDGGDETTLYYVTSAPITISATSPMAVSAATFLDAMPETTLLTQPVYYFVDTYGNNIGCFGNDPPPSGLTSITKHKGRLFAIKGQNIYFSKALSDLTTPTDFVAGIYEDCWPSSYFFDLSQLAETGKGLYSDGNILYIGTERTIRRLLGDTPLIGTTGTLFQEPESLFTNVGVVNQEVWQGVYREGTPVGTAWLAPDLRILLSDMNTYQDIGRPIQDVLSSINISSISNSCATFFSFGSYDLYIIGFPTGSNVYCDTLAVYNMRTNMWTVWNPSNHITSLLSNITSSGTVQLLAGVSDPSETVHSMVLFSSSLTSDTGRGTTTTFGVTSQTGWVSLGDASLAKVLNEIEVITGDTTNMQVTIWGAATEADFASPTVIVSAATLTQSVLGQWKVFLSAYNSRFRYFKFKFYMPPASTATQILNGYNIEAVPWNRE